MGIEGNGILKVASCSERVICESNSKCAASALSWNSRYPDRKKSKISSVVFSISRREKRLSSELFEPIENSPSIKSILPVAVQFAHPKVMP